MVKKPESRQPAHDPAQRKARGLLSVGTSLPRIASPALRKRGFAEARLITEWPGIVGEALARNTLPQKLAFARGSRSGGTLHLRVSSGFALELQHIAPQIVERINGFFGFPAVAELRYVQGPIPPQRRPRRIGPRRLPERDETRLQEAISGIEDPDLKESLERLGRAVRTGRSAGGESV